jgi:hypothetical protein
MPCAGRNPLIMKRFVINAAQDPNLMINRIFVEDHGAFRDSCPDSRIPHMNLRQIGGQIGDARR